jgi:putative hydrolase of the HAD superfamily
MPADQTPRNSDTSKELEMVAKFAPLIYFDEAEPFLPLVVGYTIFKSEEQSPSFFRHIKRDWRPAWTTTVEYAIWWDWDIGHLYELEHVWVYLDEDEHLVWVEASSHGGYASMILDDGTIPCKGTHPLVYSQPGKHAFSPTPHWFVMFRDLVCQAASVYAGGEGVLVKEQYTRQIPEGSEINALARDYLRHKAFTPTLNFNRPFQITADHLIPWAVLDAWIPNRMNWWIEQLHI